MAMFAHCASLLLAVLLRALRFCRVPLAGEAFPPARAPFVLSCLAGAVVLLGGPDAVSGASAFVSGAVKYNGTTPVGSPTNSMVEPAGEVFKYRITVSNPGVDINKNYFNCIPLPPGLTLNTNLGAAGYITGVPTAVGAYPVTLVAGNLNYPTPSTLPALIVIFPANAPPAITNQPASLGVVAGSTAAFVVRATGSLPLNYQWTFNGTHLAGGTASSLTLSNVAPDAAGDYRVVLTNAFGSVTSAVARLTLREPFLINLLLGGSVLSNGTFRFQVTGPIYTNYVIWRSTDLGTWTPIQTNWVTDGFLDFADPARPVSSGRFYRVSLPR